MMNVQPGSKSPDPISTVSAGTANLAASMQAQSGESVKADSSKATARAVAARVQPTPEQMKNVSDMLNREIARVSQTLRFSVDQQTGKTVIKVLDTSTDEVIKQIPSEDALELSKALDRLQGLLIKGKA
jgi:flagellar protein FlaG